LRYLVEPNVKEGKGGLRDPYAVLDRQTCLRVREAKVTPASSAAEVGLFERCEEFLWRVAANALRDGTRRRSAAFDVQTTIASVSAITTAADVAGRALRRHYFLVAKEVGDLTAIVCAALEEKQAKPRAIFERFLQPFRRRRSRAPQGDFIVDHDRISIVDADVFKRDPVNIIRLFWMADHHGLPLHPDALRA
jgi:[protein-PII] uridylyltransferase